MKNILLTGADGYVGWPTALRLAARHPEARIIGVDNLGRRTWVEESGAVSAVPVSDMDQRLEAAREHGLGNISFVQGDLTDQGFVRQLFAVYKFDAVLHAAAQPSAPYSQINGERAAFTQANNNQMLVNLLWAVREAGLAESCAFIETTTTGVYGAPGFPIPEGFVTAEHKGKRDTIPFGNMAGSWYHMTKCFDANNLWLANKQWSMNILDLRTAIVYGADTEETRLDERLATRFDFDFYFGIVVNRFCAMALTGHPITVYGQGEQKKPIIHLEDCVESCANCVDFVVNDGAAAPGKFTVMNQTTEAVSIGDLAHGIADAAKGLGQDAKVTHIPNPRVEDEEHKMEIDNEHFMKLLGREPLRWKDAAGPIIERLLPYKDVLARYRDRFMS